jgi:hypothetical protein
MFVQLLTPLTQLASGIQLENGDLSVRQSTFPKTFLKCGIQSSASKTRWFIMGSAMIVFQNITCPGDSPRVDRSFDISTSLFFRYMSKPIINGAVSSHRIELIN